MPPALAVKDATIGAEGAATVKANVTNAVKIDGSGPATITLTGSPSCTIRRQGLGVGERLPLIERRAGLHARQEVPQRAGQLFARGDRLGLLALGQPVEQLAAHRAMLDVGIFMDPEEAQSLLLADPVAVDQALDLGAGDAGELAFIGIKRAEARRV